MNLENIKNIHFVGIGGIGMSGIAEILSARGIHVSGCDLKTSSGTDLLVSRGIEVAAGHDPAHVKDADLVVYTSAVKGSNAELDAARGRGIPVVKRKEILGAIANEKRGVAVSGTHGKTTTSAMIACILEEAGLEPTVIVGGMLRNLGTNARNGRGPFAVVEADEYDRSFHELRPDVAVVTNIEPDHLEYYQTFEAIEEAFAIFAGQARVVVGCVDEAAVAKLMNSLGSSQNETDRIVRPPRGYKTIGYGLSADAEVRAVDITFHDRGSSFEVPGVGFFKLFAPGEHNVRNALAAITVARELGIDAATIAGALAKFLGVNRRFQILGDYAGAIVVDDYAHHPTEIRATLAAARRGYPERRLIALFQPHLYSRTIDFARQFAEALAIADVALVAPIYAAREQPVDGISARIISDASERVEFLDRGHTEILNELRRRLRPNDLFITMGAGDVHEIAEALVRGAA
jgi:UDP-N-acetylmuramate--alanine ligase